MNTSRTKPDLNTILESNEGVLTSSLYTLPSTLPLLELYFPRNNGPSLLSNQNGHPLTSVAGCQECMASALQDNSGGESNATQGRPDTTVHALEDDIAHAGSVSLSMCKKGKKHRHALPGAIQGNPCLGHGKS